MSEKNPKLFDSSLNWKNVLGKTNSLPLKSNVVKPRDVRVDIGMRKKEYICNTSYQRPGACPLENGKKKIVLKQYVPTLQRTEYNPNRTSKLNLISR